MRKVSSKAIAAATAPQSLADVTAQFAAFVANNPDAQKALAMQMLLSPARATRGARKSVSAPQTEADRACECAHFVSGNRRDLLIACIDMLGVSRDEMRISEKALCDATGLASYRVRPDMQTVQDRLNDTDNLAQFPRIRECGYKVRLAQEVRGTPREYIFSRVSSATAPRKPRAKGKALVAQSPAKGEGEKSA
jgi:hypothetical protein